MSGAFAIENASLLSRMPAITFVVPEGSGKSR